MAGEAPRSPRATDVLFSLEVEVPDSLSYLTELDVDVRHILHGEQSFAYHSLAHAGETLMLQPKITDVCTKTGGALEILVKRTDVTRTTGEPVAEAVTSAVISHSEVSP